MTDSDRNDSGTPSDVGYNSMTQTSQHCLDDFPNDGIYHSTPVRNTPSTSEQLAWAFRAARDKLETASNISDCSDRPHSNLSSISDVTGYEEELFRIRKLLESEEGPQVHKSFNKKPLIPPATHHDPRVIQLQSRIEELFTENEQHKIEIQCSEERVQLLWDKKYQECLRQKAHCEGQLHSATVQIEALLKDRENTLNKLKYCEVNAENSLHTEVNSLKCQLCDLEILNTDFKKKSDQLQFENETSKEELINIQQENEELRISKKTLEIDLETKSAAVHGLKEQLAGQYFQLQAAQSDLFKAQSSNTSLKNELDVLSKTVKWYTEQLHACQEAKKNLQTDLLTAQTKYIEQGHHLEQIKIENAVLSQKNNDLYEKSMREKEILVKRLELIQSDIIEHESMIRNTNQTETLQKDIKTSDKQNEDINQNALLTDIQENKIEIHDLREQIHKLEILLKNKNSIQEKYEKDNKELIVRLTTVQKCLNDKEISEQTLQNNYCIKQFESEQLLNSIKNIETNLCSVKNDKTNLEVALKAAVKEKLEIDKAVNKLREDFFKMAESYNRLKCELQEKDGTVAALEKEKLQIFMENNWKICEIEHLHNKILDVKILQTEFLELKNKYEEENNAKEILEREYKSLASKVASLEGICKEFDEKVTENQELNNILVEVQTKNDSLNTVCEEQQKKIIAHIENENKLNSNLTELQYVLSNREKQILENLNQYQLLQLDVTNQEKVIKNLTLNQDSLLLNNTKTEKLNSELIKENEKLTDEISRYQTTIEQYYLLFKAYNNNENKNMQTTHVTNSNSLAQTTYREDLALVIAGIHSFQMKMQTLFTEFNTSIKSDDHVSTVSIDGTEWNINNIEKLFASLVEDMEAVVNIHKNLKLEIGILNKNFFDLEIDKVAMERKYQDSQEVMKNLILHQTKNVRTVGQQTNIVNDNDQESTLVKLNNLKTTIRVNEICYKEKYKRFENNIRTLLKTIKDHMRGRKLAEKNVEVVKQMNYDLKLREESIKLALETSNVTNHEYKSKIDQLQTIILDLEKEVGKYDLVDECNNINLTQAALVKELEYKLENVEQRLIQSEKDASTLKNSLDEERLLVLDLNRKLIDESRNCNLIKKRLAPLQQEIDRLNTVCELKSKEVIKCEQLYESFQKSEAIKCAQLLQEQENLAVAAIKLQLLHQENESCRNQEMCLKEEISTLKLEVLTKSRELKTLQDNLQIIAKRFEEKEDTLKEVIILLKNDLTHVMSDLDSVRNNKLTLQKHCAELRAALQGSMEQNEILKGQFDRDSCDIKPDITANLPSPTRFDSSHISRLLELNSSSSTTPLTNLQTCLDSLKDEITILQQQVTSNSNSKGIR